MYLSLYQFIAFHVRCLLRTHCISRASRSLVDRYVTGATCGATVITGTWATSSSLTQDLVSYRIRLVLMLNVNNQSSHYDQARIHPSIIDRHDSLLHIVQVRWHEQHFYPKFFQYISHRIFMNLTGRLWLGWGSGPLDPRRPAGSRKLIWRERERKHKQTNTTQIMRATRRAYVLHSWLPIVNVS